MTAERIDPDDWDHTLALLNGPQLIVAGPGTGKTTFLARRAAAILESGVAPSQILVLTFSRRGASRLRDTITAAAPAQISGLSVSTFHSFAYRLLEAHAPAAFGWNTMPTLLTGPEHVSVVAGLLATETRADWPLPFRPLLDSRSFAEEVADFIMRSQEYLLDDAALSALAAPRADWRGLVAFRARYLKEIAGSDRIDYGTLQARAVELAGQTDIQDALSNQYHYVLVDEYQDTTAAQAALLGGVTERRRNLTVVADPLQSVYSFRGAELDNVDQFGDRFASPDQPVKQYVLTTSFRVPAVILDAANRLVPHAEAIRPVIPAPHAGRLDRLLFTQQSHEAEWIAKRVQQMHVTESVPYQKMAVLVRSKRRFLAELSRALERRAIPHDSPDTRLADHPGVRAVFDIANVAHHHDARVGTGPADDCDRAIRRLLLGPLFRTALATERDLLRLRRSTGNDWATILEAYDSEWLGPLATLIRDNTWATELPGVDGFWHIWSTLPQFEGLVASPSAAPYRAAWSALAQAVERQFERDPHVGLHAYGKLTEQDDFEANPLLSFRPDGDRLTLTTLHQSKGLEFDVVFIADATEGTFPDLRRNRSLLQPHLLSPNHDIADSLCFRLAEERRLAYTATTRAARHAIWTATSAGIDETDKRPSRFLAALDDDAPINVVDETDEIPVTPLEAEALLRRRLTDPAVGAGIRLAAAEVLARRPNRSVRHPLEFAGVRPRGGDHGLIPDETTFSPSQATSYDACPRRYAFERRLGIASEFGRYATFGSLIHDVLEQAERGAVGSGTDRSTLDDALRWLDELFGTYDLDVGARQLAWYNKATKLLTELYTDWIRPGATAVILEHTLTMDINDTTWNGRADRIERQAEGELRVVDYKTSTSIPTQAEAAESIQLAFYLAAAQKDPQVLKHGTPTEAEFWYPAADRKKKWVAFDPSRLDEVLASMAEIAEGIRAEDWTPRIGAHCNNCSVKLVCPLWPEGREAFVR